MTLVKMVRHLYARFLRARHTRNFSGMAKLRSFDKKTKLRVDSGEVVFKCGQAWTALRIAYYLRDWSSAHMTCCFLPLYHLLTFSLFFVSKIRTVSYLFLKC